MLLGEVSSDRNNNLNVIRFIASVMVIFSHAYPISCGDTDPLSKLTDGQMHFGSLAVCAFFFFSGFFIDRSVHKQPSFQSFFRARCVRIFPCLIMVVFFCVFVLGACVTECHIREYFTNIKT